MFFGEFFIFDCVMQICVVLVLFLVMRVLVLFRVVMNVVDSFGLVLQNFLLVQVMFSVMLLSMLIVLNMWCRLGVVVLVYENGGEVMWLLIWLLLVSMMVVVFGCGSGMVIGLSLLNCLLLKVLVVVICSIMVGSEVLMLGMVMWFLLEKLVSVFMFGLCVIRYIDDELSDDSLCIFIVLLWVLFYSVRKFGMFSEVMFSVFESMVLLMMLLLLRMWQLILMLFRLVVLVCFFSRCLLVIIMMGRQRMLQLWEMWILVVFVWVVLMVLFRSDVVSVVVMVRWRMLWWGLCMCCFFVGFLVFWFVGFYVCWWFVFCFIFCWG